MEIIHKIKMDLVRQGITPRIPVVQGDTFSRKLTVSLFADRKPWKIPPDASVVIRYLKPDHTSGSYDTLADGTSAASVSGNNVSILVAPEALSMAGPVALMVTILQGQKRLSTFAIGLDVQSDCTSGLTDEEGAAWIAAFLPSPDGAVVGQYLAVNTVDEHGHVLSVTAEDFPGVTQAALQEELEAYMQEHPVFDGQDGVSVTHEWNGTVLTVTSANGTSSANLKGEKGDTGAQGIQGETGAAGLTPFIGENGNWWIGNTDTGVSASGTANVEILAEQTVTDSIAIGGIVGDELDVALDLVLGATYIVTWNGTEYTCQCATGASAGGTTIVLPYLGNPGIYLANSGAADYPDTGEPFLIIAASSSTAVMFEDAAESHTVAVHLSGVQTPTPITHAWDGTVLTVTSASGTSSADLKGEKGDAGENGLTPSIGENGNWWIGETDTGVTAAGGSSDGAGLPTVTADDDGKFLRVVSGAWAAVALDAAEEASF